MPKSWWEKKVKRTKQTLEELNSAHRRSQAKWGSNIGFVHPASYYLFLLHPAQRNVESWSRLLGVNVTGRQALKWIENTLYCFPTNGNIPEMRTWNPQWNAEGQNRATTWKTSARGFSSLGLFVWSKWYIMLRNHLCSLCYWNSIFYIICNLQIWLNSEFVKLW